jgi:hypothetical protein
MPSRRHPSERAIGYPAQYRQGRQSAQSVRNDKLYSDKFFVAAMVPTRMISLCPGHAISSGPTLRVAEA